MSVLKVDKLCKKIGKKEILKDVSFEINEGDILAFIGPNGAGKTTTIKCILGLQKMNSGSVFINGYDIKHDFVQAINKVGSIVEEPEVYMYLSGFENLKLQMRMYKNVVVDDIYRVVDLVGLESRIHDKVSKYSLGMRQRLGIAMALLHSPNLLVLDEPTNGLDPEGIKDLRVLLKRLAKSGVAILISSHNLAELDNFCNKVCIIKNGKVIETSDIEAIKKTDDLNTKIFEVNSTTKLKEIVKNVEIISETQFRIHLEREQIPMVVEKLVERGIKVYGITEEEKSLEDAFFEKTGGNIIG